MTSTLNQAIYQWVLDPKEGDYEMVVTQQLKTVQGIVLCLLDALGLPADPQLKRLQIESESFTDTEAHILCSQGRRLLTVFLEHWAGLDWDSVLPQPPRDRENRFRRFVTLDVMQDLIEWGPLHALSSHSAGHIVLPEHFASTLKAAIRSAAEAVGHKRGHSWVGINVDKMEGEALARLDELHYRMGWDRSRVSSPVTMSNSDYDRDANAGPSRVIQMLSNTPSYQ